jgi:DNA-binding transcriptional LysR family regulator
VALQGQPGRGTKALTVEGPLHLSHALSIREAALAGVGIADLAHYLVERDLEEGRLVRVLESFARVQRGIYVLHAPSPFTPSKVRFFVDALKKSFKRSSATFAMTVNRAGAEVSGANQ